MCDSSLLIMRTLVQINNEKSVQYYTTLSAIKGTDTGYCWWYNGIWWMILRKIKNKFKTLFATLLWIDSSILSCPFLVFIIVSIVCKTDTLWICFDVPLHNYKLKIFVENKEPSLICRPFLQYLLGTMENFTKISIINKGLVI